MRHLGFVLVLTAICAPACKREASVQAGSEQAAARPVEIAVDLNFPGNQRNARFAVSGGEASRLDSQLMIEIYGNCPGYGADVMNDYGSVDLKKLTAKCPGAKKLTLYIHEKGGAVTTKEYSGLKEGNQQVASLSFFDAPEYSVDLESAEPGKGVVLTKVTDSEIEGKFQWKSKNSDSQVTGPFKVPVRKKN